MVHHPLSISTTNINVQLLPPPFISTELEINTIDIQKRPQIISYFIALFQDYRTHVSFNSFFFKKTLLVTVHFGPIDHKNPFHRTKPQDLLVAIMIVKITNENTK